MPDGFSRPVAVMDYFIYVCTLYIRCMNRFGVSPAKQNARSCRTLQNTFSLFCGCPYLCVIIINLVHPLGIRYNNIRVDFKCLLGLVCNNYLPFPTSRDYHYTRVSYRVEFRVYRRGNMRNMRRQSFSSRHVLTLKFFSRCSSLEYAVKSVISHAYESL